MPRPPQSRPAPRRSPRSPSSTETSRSGRRSGSPKGPWPPGSPPPGGGEVPFERLVDLLEPRRDRSHPPLVQVMLVLQNAPLAVVPPPGLRLTARETDNGTARFDLALSLVPDGEDMAAVFKYSRDLFDAPTVLRLAGHFAALLAGGVADPARRLSALPLLAAPERHQVTVARNDTAPRRPAE